MDAIDWGLAAARVRGGDRYARVDSGPGRDGERVRTALEELAASLHHQRQAFPATAAAVPLLVDTALRTPHERAEQVVSIGLLGDPHHAHGEARPAVQAAVRAHAGRLAVLVHDDDDEVRAAAVYVAALTGAVAAEGFAALWGAAAATGPRVAPRRSASAARVPTMGLHCGYLVATAEPDALLAELSRHAGEFTPGAVVDRTAEAEIDSGNFDMLLGGGDGRAYLVDTSMSLSNSPDMIIAMSAALGTVVGAGAETVSGSYWLAAARDGEALRYVFVSDASMTRGMAIGDPLPSEEEFPLVDITGDGVFAALAVFGLDPSAWLESGPAAVVAFDATRFPDNGPVSRIRRRHYEQHQRPDDEWLQNITAVAATPSRRRGSAEG